MKQEKISEAVVRRLPTYLQLLHELDRRDVETVSSQELGDLLGLNPAQIRKDLAYFGDFGRKGVGYDVQNLIGNIRNILKLNQTINVALVGTGNLGHALCNYNKYSRDNNLKIVAVFDQHPNKIGTQINNLTVQPMSELKQTVEEQYIRIGIITVPDDAAQSVANQFVEAGIEGILNFAPAVLKVPDEIRVHYADFTRELLSLAFYLENERSKTE
ncbi:redox-sensing transcriptional repressor Rex [Paenibacillus protaetiae]|uniref:Redox-sensing transcriptional repressor Rex n=1 Tax=Paenibacillus protaetiae TaxID=2509456 RepID=A0A4P6ETZ5_9BACL|nr:redox-sensing transcriptional repressor Rex [Paenibacillus protaetiae]QAY66126.1 redox-sensing transcriptional repressor Rex [Paenibacillus protaetiae]